MIYKRREDGFKVTVDQSRYQLQQNIVAIFKFKSAMKIRKQMSEKYGFIYNHMMTGREATQLLNYMLETYPTNSDELHRSLLNSSQT